MSDHLENHCMVPKPSQNVIFKELSEGGVLFHTTQEVYYGLNEVGCRVWKLLESSSPGFDALCEAVHAEYQSVDLETIRADVSELVDELVGFGLLTAQGVTNEQPAAPVSAS